MVEAEAGYGNQLIGKRSRLGEGLSGSAAESGRPVLANSPGLAPESVSLAPGVRSALSLPLQYQDGLLGVLSLESRRDHAFAPQDVLTLKTLADQLSIALHNARAYQNALEEAITDGLTGLKTHRYFMEALERELRLAQRAGRPFAVIMMDLDQFKPVNDRYGHLQGDRVLSTIAKSAGDQVRQSSILSRYGGDEFSILMPDATAEQALILAERLRASIERDTFLSTHRVTASFGIGASRHGCTHETSCTWRMQACTWPSMSMETGSAWRRRRRSPDRSRLTWGWSSSASSPPDPKHSTRYLIASKRQSSRRAKSRWWIR